MILKKKIAGSTTSKDRKLNIKNQIVEKYRNMDEECEKNHYYKTAKGFYRKGLDSIRLIKWMAYYDKDFENKIYSDLMTFVLSCLKKYLNGKYYVEVKCKRYTIYPTENVKLWEPKPAKSLRSQNQVQNESKRGREQKILKIAMINCNSNEILKRKNQFCKNLYLIFFCVLVVYRKTKLNSTEANIGKIENFEVTNENIKWMKFTRQNKNVSTRLTHRNEKVTQTCFFV